MPWTLKRARRASQVASVFAASGGGSAATTWNPSDLSNVSLSGGNLIATLTATNFGGVRSIASVATNQLVYWENTITTLTVGDSMTLGFSTSGTAYGGTATPGAITPATAFYFHSNNRFFDQDSVNHFVSVFGSAVVQGDTVDIAYNSLTGKAWARHNNGAWNDALASQDPSTGTGGMATTLTGSPSTPLYATFAFDASNGNKITTVFSSASWARTPPTLFTQLA